MHRLSSPWLRILYYSQSDTKCYRSIQDISECFTTKKLVQWEGTKNICLNMKENIEVPYRSSLEVHSDGMLGFYNQFRFAPNTWTVNFRILSDKYSTFFSKNFTYPMICMYQEQLIRRNLSEKSITLMSYCISVTSECCEFYLQISNFNEYLLLSTSLDFLCTLYKQISS